jgi:alkylated DNA repair dioxygenase AlkB
MPWVPDQMIANEYEPGTGIFAHVDLTAFDDTIVSISLASACVMQFIESESGATEAVFLEPASSLVLSGDARYKWKHMIAPRHADQWMGREIVRGRRVSLTFRKMVVPVRGTGRDRELGR